MGPGGSRLGQAGSCAQPPSGLAQPSLEPMPPSASVAVRGELRDGCVLLALAALPGLPAGPLPAHICQVSEGPPGLGAPDGEY